MLNFDDPTIREDRTKARSAKAVLDNLKGKSFAEEIENDVEKSAVLMGRAAKAQEKYGADHPITKHEQESAAVYKRALMAIGASGMEAISTDGETQSLADNGLPVSTYLSHGSRVTIQVPAGSGDKLINWLTSGNKDVDGKSRSQSQKGAIKENKVVYNRSAATHAVGFEKDENGQTKTKELKGFAIGAKDFFGNKLFGIKTKHWGVDLAMNAEFEGKDSEGKKVSTPDGDHGHLYMYYEPPTKDRPGAILIGCEGAAPSSSKHSKTGKSDPLSPVDGSKYPNLTIKKDIATEAEYKDTIVPKKYNGLMASVDMEAINQIVAMDDKNHGPELAAKIPSKSASGFAASKTHTTPEMKPSKKFKATLKKPNLAKRIINKLTFGFAFKKEIAAYKDEKKTLKIKATVEQQDGRRDTLEKSKKVLEKASPNKQATVEQVVLIAKRTNISKHKSTSAAMSPPTPKQDHKGRMR